MFSAVLPSCLFRRFRRASWLRSTEDALLSVVELTEDDFVVVPSSAVVDDDGVSAPVSAVGEVISETSSVSTNVDKSSGMIA